MRFGLAPLYLCDNVSRTMQPLIKVWFSKKIPIVQIDK